MKKQLLFILVLLLFFCQACSVPSNNYNKEVVINGIEYHLYDYDDEPYYYVYQAQNKNITSVAIEEYINGYPVRKIGRDDSGWLVSPFENCTNLTTISIPNTVQVIGNSAFEGCTSLETIALPNSIEVIYSFAFQRCTSFKLEHPSNAYQEISLRFLGIIILSKELQNSKQA